ncbi:hypothetical protein GCM10010965_11000 [Caldalkalibacillus thermarum]|nr:hypothetical protein GCM10010965_11000 [Caldalkalibacillus thermarum]
MEDSVTLMESHTGLAVGFGNGYETETAYNDQQNEQDNDQGKWRSKGTNWSRHTITSL